MNLATWAQFSRSNDLDSEMRQSLEAAQAVTMSGSHPISLCGDAQDRPQMPRTQAPKMQIGDFIALKLYGLSDLVGEILALCWLTTRL